MDSKEKQDIRAQLKVWIEAVGTGDPSAVAALYEEEAVLVPTISNQVRATPDQVKDYFVDFLRRGPRGEIELAYVHVFEDTAVASGLYTFRFSSGELVPARFSFVYRRRAGRWRIVAHHSSVMPEGCPSAQGTRTVAAGAKRMPDLAVSGPGRPGFVPSPPR